MKTDLDYFYEMLAERAIGTNYSQPLQCVSQNQKEPVRDSSNNEIDHSKLLQDHIAKRNFKTVVSRPRGKAHRKSRIRKRYENYIISGGWDTFEIWKKKQKGRMKSPRIYFGYNTCK